MKVKPLTTHEVGSLAKPNWRVKALTGRTLSDRDVEQAAEWSAILELNGDSEQLISILSKRENFSTQDKATIRKFSGIFGTRLLEKSGLDLVYDGEQNRIEMYEFPIRRSDGFNFLGHVRSFDNKYYRKARCVEKPSVRELFHVEEFHEIKSYASKPLKVPVTGAYTIVDWSFDEHYMKQLNIADTDFLRKRRNVRAEFLTDVSRELIYPNIRALIKAGAKYIQIDEPAATTKRNEIDLFIQSVIDSVGDISNEMFLTLHICFSDYTLLFPGIRKLEGIVNEVHLEYANRDTRELGTSSDKRKGYGLLDTLKNYDFIVGLGTIDVHTDFVEPAELVRDRILYAVNKVGDPERIFVAPDCGLRTRNWRISFEKLRNMVEGTRMAEKILGLG